MDDVGKHTAGPWFVHDFTGVQGKPIPFDVTASCDHPATITVASMGNALTATLDEARANARLIAAAPDLLAFAQACADDNDDCVSPGIKEKARSAIQKATS